MGSKYAKCCHVLELKASKAQGGVVICGVHIRRDVTNMGIVCDISVWCVTVVTDTCSLVIET